MLSAPTQLQPKRRVGGRRNGQSSCRVLLQVAIVVLIAVSLPRAANAQSTIECLLGLEDNDVDGSKTLSFDEYRLMLNSFAREHHDNQCLQRIPRNAFVANACLCKEYELASIKQQHMCSCDRATATIATPGTYQPAYSNAICETIAKLWNSPSNLIPCPTLAPSIAPPPTIAPTNHLRATGGIITTNQSKNASTMVAAAAARQSNNTGGESSAMVNGLIGGFCSVGAIAFVGILLLVLRKRQRKSDLGGGSSKSLNDTLDLTESSLLEAGGGGAMTSTVVPNDDRSDDSDSHSSSNTQEELRPHATEKQEQAPPTTTETTDGGRQQLLQDGGDPLWVYERGPSAAAASAESDVTAITMTNNDDNNNDYLHEKGSTSLPEPNEEEVEEEDDIEQQQYGEDDVVLPTTTKSTATTSKEQLLKRLKIEARKAAKSSRKKRKTKSPTKVETIQRSIHYEDGDDDDEGFNSYGPVDYDGRAAVDQQGGDDEHRRTTGPIDVDEGVAIDVDSMNVVKNASPSRNMHRMMGSPTKVSSSKKPQSVSSAREAFRRASRKNSRNSLKPIPEATLTNAPLTAI